MYILGSFSFYKISSLTKNKSRRKESELIELYKKRELQAFLTTAII